LWLVLGSVAGCAALVLLLIWVFSGATRQPEKPTQPAREPKAEAANPVEPAKELVSSADTSVPPSPASSGIVSGHLAQARDAYNQGQYKKALREYQAVLKLDPKNAQARAGLQTVHAAMAAEASAGLASGDTEETLKRAEASYASGEYSAAIAGFQQVLGQDPGNARATKGLAHAKAAYQAEQQAFGNTK
jgi:tetratricopeptide (TPR) repeat protein